MCMGMVRLLRKYSIAENDVQYVWKRYAEDLKYFNTHFILFMQNNERAEFVRLIKNDLPLLHELMPKSSWLMTHCLNLYLKLAEIFVAPLRLVRDIKRR